MTALLAQADAGAVPLADKSVDLVFTSPPYMDARTYGIDAQRGCIDWIEWMLTVVAECVRVSRGLVLVNCAGVTRNWCYRPGPEGLLYEWWKRGGRCWRPAYWYRVGIAGSGHKQWLRADVEYILAFTGCEKSIPWANNTANGHPPKWGPGGAMSNRLGDGRRVNQWGHSFDTGATGGSRDNITTQGVRPSHVLCGRNRRSNGDMKPKGYGLPVLANPGNVVKVTTGGGHLGHPLAHENEAPFPEDLAAWFIRSHCPPGGIVLDPFSGSGTTVAAAQKLGRLGIGFDLRMSQCELARRRLETPWLKKQKKVKASPESPSLFAATA